MKLTKLEQELLEALETMLNTETAARIGSQSGALEGFDWKYHYDKAREAIRKVKIVDLVYNAKPNEHLDLSRLHDHFTEVTFDYDRREDEYSWSARTKHSVVPVLPSQSSQYVKYFKTLDGAKRNFLRRV